MQHALNSIAKQLAVLESLDNDATLDGGGGQDYQAMLLRLESSLAGLAHLFPPIVNPPQPLAESLSLDRSGTDRELRRRNELYTPFLEAIGRKHRIDPNSQADDRLLLAE